MTGEMSGCGNEWSNLEMCDWGNDDLFVKKVKIKASKKLKLNDNVNQIFQIDVLLNR